MRYMIIALPLLISLTACGPSLRTENSDYQRPVTRPVTPPDTYFTRDAARRTLLNDFGALDLSQGADLPFTSRLEYRGLMNAALGSSQTVIGKVDIDVDTVRDTISGSATDFVDRNNRDLDGELEIFRGTFTERPGSRQNQAVAGVRGTLTDVFRRDYSVSGQLEGDVLGRNAQAFEGTISGAVKIDGGPQEGVKGGVVARRLR